MVLFIAVSILLGTTASSYDENVITESVKTAVLQDEVSAKDLENLYVIFNSTYIFGKQFGFSGCKNFSDITSRQLAVGEKLGYITLSNKNVSDTVFEVLSKYEYKDLNETSKQDYCDDLYFVIKGIKESMETKRE